VAVYGLVYGVFLSQSGPKDGDPFLVFHSLQYWRDGGMETIECGNRRCPFFDVESYSSGGRLSLVQPGFFVPDFPDSENANSPPAGLSSVVERSRVRHLLQHARQLDRRLPLLTCARGGD
jgi:hypothetical protein